jgi:hypothetical protein
MVFALFGLRRLARFRWVAVGLLVVMAIFDFFTMPIASGLTVFAVFGPKRLARFRWVAVGLMVVIVIGHGAMHEVRERYVYGRKLDRDETVAGVPLPAGSRIRFEDTGFTTIDYIKLPRVTRVAGIPFTGTMRFLHGGERPATWSGTLAADQNISGWPCQSGEYVQIQLDGSLYTCRLASAHTFFDYELPAGTAVQHWMDWYFDLPPDKGLAIKVLDTTAPPGIRIKIASDGRLKTIDPYHASHRGDAGKTIVVRGYPLKAVDVEVSPESVTGQLAEPFTIGGVQQPAGTRITINLAAPN